jgi:hypothetical protein
MDDLGLSPAEYRVLGHLIRRMNGQRKCNPGQRSMAEITRLNKDTVRDVIATLESLHIISVTRGDGRGHTSSYTIQPSSEWKKKGVYQPHSKGGSKGDTKGGRATDKGGSSNPLKGGVTGTKEPSGEEPKEEEPKINNNNPEGGCCQSSRREDSKPDGSAKEEADSLASLDGSVNLAGPKISNTGNTLASNTGNTILDTHLCICGGHAVIRLRLKDKLPFLGCSNLGPDCTTFHPANGSKEFANILGHIWDGGPATACGLVGDEIVNALREAMPPDVLAAVVEKWRGQLEVTE